MIENLGGVTSQLVHLALDASLIRHKIIANNIANVDTPGFSSKRLSFEDYFTRFSGAASTNQANAMLSNEIESIKSLLNQKHTLVFSEEGEVQLDREMVELSENVIRYRALLDANGKRGELLKMAVSGGRT